MTTRSPSLAEVIRDAMNARMADVYTSIPGEIVEYYPATRTADVRPLVKRVDRDPNGGRGSEEHPTIYGAPVAGFGNTKWMMTFPLEPGDEVLLMFCHQDIEDWQENGGVADPLDARRHDLSDAVVIPSLLSKPSAEGSQEASVTGMVVGANDDNGQIYLTNGLIELGGEGAGDKVPLDSALQTELNAIKSAIDTLTQVFNAHVHTTAIPLPLIPLPPGTPVPTLIPTSPQTNSYSVGTTGSVLVTIEE